MTNWKLLLRKYMDHVADMAGRTYTNHMPEWMCHAPLLSADELAVLRELSEQTTESVAAEDEERRSKMWMCGLCGATYGEEVLKCHCKGTWQCKNCEAIHPERTERCPYCSSEEP